MPRAYTLYNIKEENRHAIAIARAKKLKKYIDKARIHMIYSIRNTNKVKGTLEYDTL